MRDRFGLYLGVPTGRGSRLLPMMERLASGLDKRMKSRMTPTRVALVAILAAFAALALWDLGAPSLPSSLWSGGEVSVTVLPDGPIDTIYLHIVTPDSVVVRPECLGTDGSPIRSLQSRLWVDEFQKWVSFSLPCQNQVRLLITSDAHLGEIYLFKGFEKRSLRTVSSEVGDPTALFDEQGLLSWPPTYFYRTAFDENIYARVSYDFLTKSPPYDHFDHPPLAKDFIALSMAEIGNSPLGWRLPQVVSGTMLVLLIYLLGSQLGGSRVGLLAASLLVMSPIHLTQSRLALLDVHLAMFATLAVLLFVLFLRFQRPLLLFLAFTAFGSAIAVKWTMWPLFLVFLLLLVGELRTINTRKYVPALVAGVLAAGTIYAASYIPYYAHGFGLVDVLKEQCCGPRSILGYHTGYFRDNDLQSPWWTWPLLPAVHSSYASTIVEGQVSTVAAAGNPFLTWLSLPVMVWFLREGLRKPRPPASAPAEKNSGRIFPVGLTEEQKRAFRVLPFAFFALWISFIPVGNNTYFYHYYPPLILSLPVLAFWINHQSPIRKWFYLAVTALFFALLLPLATGQWVPISFARSVLGWIPGWSI